MCTMRWFLVSEGWGGFVDNVREMDLRNMRCVSCGCIDDPVTSRIVLLKGARYAVLRTDVLGSWSHCWSPDMAGVR